jgi:hypothetical protein
MICGANGGQMVPRRYSDFVKLSWELRRHSDFEGLPDLPPASFFRKRLLTGFMQTRRQGLSKILAAAVASDPFICTAVLREFLDLPCLGALAVFKRFEQPSTVSVDKYLGNEGSDESTNASTSSALSISSSRRLYTIAETAVC